MTADFNSTVSSNLSTSSPNSSSVHYFTCSDTRPWRYILISQLCFSILGNALILWSVKKDKRLRTTTNYYIVNISASDMIAAMMILGQSFGMKREGQWPVSGVTGSILCKLFVMINVMPYSVSEFTCLLMSFDLYQVVARPFKRRFKNNFKRTILGIWFSAAIVSAPKLYFFSAVGDMKTGLRCAIPKNIYPLYTSFTQISSTVVRTVPFLLMAIGYGLTVFKLYRQNSVPGIQNDFIIQRRQRQNKKVLKMSIAIVLLI